MNTLINALLKQTKNSLDNSLSSLRDLTLDIGNKDLTGIVTDLQKQVHEPFMFVVVGEVKVGKSSFINALLNTGKEICKVAPDPCTDTIQELVYGDKPTETAVTPNLRRITYPIDILKEISIVDTPGTNTIAEHHQDITERFIPSCDLAVFVFEAKNPYRQSAWDFFSLIQNDWHKKIIFVLQQSDLLSPKDLETNKLGLMNYAHKKGVSQPLIFPVSAKKELDGHTQESGFSALRRYIHENITGGKAPILKIQSALRSAKNVSMRIRKGLNTRSSQLGADIAFLSDIQTTLNEQENHSNQQVQLLANNLLLRYDRITAETRNELAGGLGFFSLAKRSLTGWFDKASSPQLWLQGLAEDMKVKLRNDLNQCLTEGAVDITESIQQMAQIIDLKIRHSHTLLRDDDGIFGSIAEKRNGVFRELQSVFAEFVRNKENFTASDLFTAEKNYSPDIMSGSGIAVVGVVLTSVLHGAIFDITGGLLTAIGLTFAGVNISLKRKKILEEFDAEIKKGRDKLSAEITQKLGAYIKKIRTNIEKNFDNFQSLVRNEESQLKLLTNRLTFLEKELDFNEQTLQKNL